MALRLSEGLGLSALCTLVEHIWAFLVIALAIRESDGLIAVPFVKPPSSRVLLECVELNRVRQCAMRVLQQSGSNAPSVPARQHVELIDPSHRRFLCCGEYGDDGAIFFPDHDSVGWKEMISNPPAYFVFRMRGWRERKECASGFDQDRGDGFGVLFSAGGANHVESEA